MFITGRKRNEVASLEGGWLRSARRSEAVLGIALLLPASAFMVGFVVYPIIHAVWLSFHDLYLLRGLDSIQPYGLGNFRRFLGDPESLQYIGNTAIWTLGSVAGATVLGLILALLLNRPLPFRAILRGMPLLPWVMHPVVVAILWRWILDGEWGILNYLLVSAEILSAPINWLSDERTMWATILMISCWKNVPFAFVNLLAGLQMIPEELYEAAQIDGASRFQRFWLITMPLLRPVLAIVVLLTTIWRSYDFGLLWALTRGGPRGSSTTLAILAYRSSFEFYRVAYGASIGVMLMGVMLVFTVLYMRRVRIDAV